MKQDTRNQALGFGIYNNLESQISQAIPDWSSCPVSFDALLQRANAAIEGTQPWDQLKDQGHGISRRVVTGFSTRVANTACSFIAAAPEFAAKY